ncbi:MAG TPA: AI-2E family transporter [Candidatus Paceibacterota bacterium]
MDTKKLQLYFFIGLLIAVLFLTLALFKPFIAPVALAFMMAIVVRPIDKWILTKTNGRRTLAAVLTVLFVLVVILVPLSILIEQVAVESFNFYTAVRDRGLGDAGLLASYVVKPIQNIYPTWNPDIGGYVKSVADSLVNNFGKIFSSTASIALGLFIVLVTLFYILRDGKRIKKTIMDISPLADAYDEQIIDKIERAVNSVVRGSLFTSLIKGILATLGFYIFGVDHALLWGMLTAIVSLLPGIGAGLTIIPAMLYLLVIDKVGAAIGLGIWGTVLVGLVDNILMPIVVGRGFTVHPLFVMLSLIGGIMFFGPIGLFLGPLVIALFSALIEIYKLIVLDDQNKKVMSL